MAAPKNLFSFMYTIGIHCVESVRIRSYSGLHFSRIFPYSVRMRENEEKMRTRITPNTDSFYAVTTPLNKCFLFYVITERQYFP